MTPRFILTAAETRAAEASVIAAGTSAETLMERAGVAAAEAIRRYAGTIPALVLCGPGNNGGDGYVVARELARRGGLVRVARLAEPSTPAARAAAESYDGPTQALSDAEPAPLMIDALFGTGLARALEGHISSALMRLADEARVRVAIDLPSGVASDDGAILSPAPDYDLTITFISLKPSHRLQPAARHMGRVVAADIGVPAESRLTVIARPRLRAPGPDDHKYTRGYVAVIGGEMPGASALAAAAAARAGAGFVRLVGSPAANLPAAVVQQAGETEALVSDRRMDALLAGPGLGRSAEAERLLDLALRSGRPLVLDGDALTLLAAQGFGPLRSPAILTPHEGEFVRLFPDLRGSKIERARAAAERAGCILVYKGADTVVAEPGGRAAIAPPASPWLASAGTGDVLAGVAAARLAAHGDAYAAACEAVWLHGRAAAISGAGLIADDLVDALRQALRA